MAEFFDHRDGFGIVDTARGSGAGDTYGATDMGMTAHRGDLDETAYIDPEEIRAVVEESLGFTYEDVSSAYKHGRPTAEQRQLRDRIDSRLLALSRAGGNMTVLGDALGLGHATVERALVRARANEVLPVIKRPAIQTPVVSFITGLPGARPQRRRHKGCPSHMLPVDDRRYSTINLTDAEYANGRNDRPGNPEYWKFRDRIAGRR